MDFSSIRSFGSNSVRGTTRSRIRTWESLDNIKGSNPRILENFLAKHDIAQELAAKQAEITRDQRRATAQAEEQAARTRASLTGIGWPAPLLLTVRLTRPLSPTQWDRLILVRWGRRARRVGI